MKRFLLALLSILTLASILTFASCNKDDDEDDDKGNENYTEGLEYELLDDNTYIVVGIGSATDEDLIIPDKHNGKKVTAIDWEAFMYCDTIKTVVIPDGVTYIGCYAFSECSQLTKVTIPDTVTNILGGAFSKCPNLTTVNCEAESLPSTWDSYWLGIETSPNVVWGYTGENN